MPAKLSALAGLSDLQMSHCGLKAVPQALAAAPKLKALQLEGNPFDDKKLPKVLRVTGAHVSGTHGQGKARRQGGREGGRKQSTLSCITNSVCWVAGTRMMYYSASIMGWQLVTARTHHFSSHWAHLPACCSYHHLFKRLLLLLLLLQVLKEGRLKNIITHIKKHGSPPDAAEEAEEAAAAAAKLQLTEAQKPYKLLPVNKESGLDVAVHAEVKGEHQS